MKKRNPFLTFGIVLLAAFGLVDMNVGGYHTSVHAHFHDFHQAVLGTAAFAAALFIQAIRRD